MTEVLKRIDHEVAELEAAIAVVLAKTQALHQEYVKAIAHAAQHQVILSTFQLCTKDYPHSFLLLSLATRQRLQHEVQLLAHACGDRISQLLLQSLPGIPDQILIDHISKKSTIKESYEFGAISEVDLEMIASPDPKSGSDRSSPEKSGIETNQEAIEQIITQALAETSQAVNELLGREALFSLPLAENAPRIQLRAVEVEFTNREAMSARGELRVLSARWHQLQAELLKRQKAKQVAEAELAWRASWVEYRQD